MAMVVVVCSSLAGLRNKVALVGIQLCSPLPNCRDHDDCWQPGQALPTFIPESPEALSTSTPHHQTVSRSDNTLADMLQCFQASMETQFIAVCGKLTNINERMDVLEVRQKLLEEAVKTTSSLSSSSNYSTPEPSSKVRR